MSHPQDVLHWCAAYFELIVILASDSRETTALPFVYLEELELGALPIITDYQR